MVPIPYKRDIKKGKYNIVWEVRGSVEHIKWRPDLEVESQDRIHNGSDI
jgi:hypothetical protein